MKTVIKSLAAVIGIFLVCKYLFPYIPAILALAGGGDTIFSPEQWKEVPMATQEPTLEGMGAAVVKAVAPPALKSGVDIAKAVKLTAEEIVGPITLRQVYTNKNKKSLVLTKDAINSVQARSEVAFPHEVTVVYRSGQKGLIAWLVDMYKMKEVRVSGSVLGATWVDVSALEDHLDEISGNTVTVRFPHAVYAEAVAPVSPLSFYKTNGGLVYTLQNPSKVTMDDDAVNEFLASAVPRQGDVILKNGNTLAQEAETLAEQHAKRVIANQVFNDLAMKMYALLASQPDYTNGKSQQEIMDDIKEMLDSFELEVEVIFE